MKIFMLVTAILSGWLYTEVKDFVLNGGLDNKLALIILKILFISIFLVVVGALDINYKKFIDNDGHVNTHTGNDEGELGKVLFGARKTIDSRARSLSKKRLTDRFKEGSLSSF